MNTARAHARNRTQLIDAQAEQHYHAMMTLHSARDAQERGDFSACAGYLGEAFRGFVATRDSARQGRTRVAFVNLLKEAPLAEHPALKEIGLQAFGPDEMLIIEKCYLAT